MCDDAVLALACSPDSELLATGCRNGSLTVWSLGTGKRVVEFPRAHTGAIASVAFSKEGAQVLSAAADTLARCVPAAAKGRVLCHGLLQGFMLMPVAHLRTALVGQVRVPSGAAVPRAVTCPPHSSRGVDCFPSSAVHVGARLGLMGVHAFSGLIAVCATVTVAHCCAACCSVHGLLSGKVLKEFRGHSGAVNDANFSPDGTMIVTAGNEGDVKVWTVAWSPWGLSCTMQSACAAVLTHPKLAWKHARPPPPPPPCLYPALGWRHSPAGHTTGTVAPDAQAAPAGHGPGDKASEEHRVPAAHEVRHWDSVTCRTVSEVIVLMAAGRVPASWLLQMAKDLGHRGGGGRGQKTE